MMPDAGRGNGTTNGYKSERNSGVVGKPEQGGEHLVSFGRQLLSRSPSLYLT